MNETIIHKIKSAKKACLVLQGGGMRGSYTTGAMQALVDQGLDKEFEHIVAVSAGALNAAYFKTDRLDPEKGGGIYIDCLSSKEFVNFANTPQVLDIDFLMYNMRNVRPLDVNLLRTGGPEIHVCVTNADTLKSEVFLSSHKDIFEALHASASVPIAYNRTVIVGENRYIDGGVTHGIPYSYAKSLDADLFVVILTNPLRYRYQDARVKAMLADSKLVANFYDPKLLGKLREMDEQHNKDLNEIEVESHNYYNVEALFPSNAKRLTGMLEIDKQKLIDCQKMGYDDAQFFLTSRSEDKPHEWVPKTTVDIPVRR